MPSSEPTLSIVLPVHNLQNTLATQVIELLDILPDLTDEFEVLIIDDGSTDHTFEVAHDLEVLYPQVKVVRFQEMAGAEAVVRAGYENTSGDVVVVQPENTILRIQDLLEMWQLRADEGIVVARPETKATPMRSVDRLSKLSQKLMNQSISSTESMMIRREAVEEMAASESTAKRERKDPPAAPLGRRPARPYSRHSDRPTR